MQNALADFWYGRELYDSVHPAVKSLNRRRKKGQERGKQLYGDSSTEDFARLFSKSRRAKSRKRKMKGEREKE